MQSEVVLYHGMVERITEILSRLNDIEKLPDDPMMPYLGSPIPCVLDGVVYGEFANDIGDEWCWKYTPQEVEE